MKPHKVVSSGNHSLTIVEATTLMGIRRSILQEEMAQQVKQDDDPALIYLKRIAYPDLVSAVGESQGFEHWPPSFAKFIQLPDRLVSQWEKAVYEINPHWQPGYDLTPPEEKKEPTSASSAGSAGN